MSRRTSYSLASVSQSLRKAVAVSCAASVILSSAITRPAHANGLPLIRDTEIEKLLSDYAHPIFRAAGLGTGRVAIRIVRHNAFNAFVVDGRNVFVHTGAIMQSETPNQIIGVLAHETGHITGGHMAALRSRIARDQTKILLAQVLGILLIGGAAATGGDTGRDLGGAGQAVMQGGSELVMRSLLAERRSQESAADQAGLRYLSATKQSGAGMLETWARAIARSFVTRSSMSVATLPRARHAGGVASTALRTPPHNIEAEQALLGAILLNNEAFDRVSDFLKPEHFSEDLHRRIFEVLAALIRNGKVANLTTLKSHIADADLGGLTVNQYIARLAAEATTIINASDYAEVVRDLAIRRNRPLRRRIPVAFQRHGDSPQYGGRRLPA